MFTEVERCSQVSPSLVFNSVAVGLLATDFLENASLTLTLTSDNVTSSVAQASLCGAASLPITGPLYLNEIIRALVLPGL